MAVGDTTWTDQARRRGRRIGWTQVVGGAALVLVFGSGVFLTTSFWRTVLFVLTLLSVNLVLQGRRRIEVESSPSMKPPFVFPAALEPGVFAQLPEPRPAFGLRRARYRLRRLIVLVGFFFGIAVAVSAGGDRFAVSVISGVVVCLGFALWLIFSAWRSIPLEVRVGDGMVEWKAKLRSASAPVESLRRLRCNDIPSIAVVLEFEGHRPMLVPVIGGFADFLDALTSTCPWVEVSTDVVERFGVAKGKTNGYFVDSPIPVVDDG